MHDDKTELVGVTIDNCGGDKVHRLFVVRACVHGTHGGCCEQLTRLRPMGGEVCGVAGRLVSWRPQAARPLGTGQGAGMANGYLATENRVRAQSASPWTPGRALSQLSNSRGRGLSHLLASVTGQYNRLKHLLNVPPSFGSQMVGTPSPFKPGPTLT